MTGPGPHLTPEREAEIRARVERVTDLSPRALLRAVIEDATDLLAALDAERADHAQTRAVLTGLTTVGLEVLGSVRAVYGDTNQLVRDLDAQIQDAQRALGLVRPAPETT